MKSQDIVILLKLVSLEEQAKGDHLYQPVGHDPFALRNLEASLGISKTEISASLKRSLAVGLAIRPGERPKVNRRNLTEFVLHGLKYAYPASLGAPQRGIATAFAAPMLEGLLVSSGADIFVWPYAKGHQRGPSIAPLFKSVPEAAIQDERLYEFLALVDAIRIGNQREAKLAQGRFEDRIAGS